MTRGLSRRMAHVRSVVGVTAALALCAVTIAPAAHAQDGAKRTVVVDAGHGGKMVGMRAKLPDGRIVYEKTIALGIAKALADELRKRGVNVVMIRTTDVHVPNEDRGRIANEARGDLLLSIHVNQSGPASGYSTRIRGFETFFLSVARNDDERHIEAMENDIVHFETAAAAPPGDPLAFMLNSMARNEHLRESSDLAATIQSVVAPRHPGPNRGVKQAGLIVLRGAYMPAVLIETGFGSHPAEAAWLVSDAGKKFLATRIADATMQYLRKYERRVSAPTER